MMRGYFGIGIYHPKHEANVGGLWRSASLYGAAFIFTIGERYQKQATDTSRTPFHTPLFHFESIDDLITHLPHAAPLIGVELDERAQMLPGFWHPERAVYLLGAEDRGLPPEVLDRCHKVVQIPSLGEASMNVASAGTVLLYDRHVKRSSSRLAVAV